MFIAGNTGGLTCQGAVMATGKIAGLGVAESLGKISGQEADLIRSTYWSELSRVEHAFDPMVHEARNHHVQNYQASRIKVYET